MKTKRQESRKTAPAGARNAGGARAGGSRSSAKAVRAAEQPRKKYWPYALELAGVLIAAFEVYGPSLNGPFLFDDNYLPFSVPNFPLDTLKAWLVGVRPLLMFSYWINYRISGLETGSYHAFNVLFHAANAVLIFLITLKLLDFAGVERRRRDILAGFAGALFLLHPVNSEAVGYVASRSESLSVLFFFTAFAVFLYRRSTAISWVRAAGVLALFAAAALTKEHTVVLPALLLLTDYFWNPPFSFQGMRRNWRLYAPVVIGTVALGMFLLRKLRGAQTAGFAIKDLTWYQYFFTECRAFWVYIRLFLFPAGLDIDYDFPISHSLLEHGALLGLIAILAAAAAAFYYRRRYPLASYGFFAFLILMAPTSSFVPIKDPVAERRLYLSMIGLLLIALEFLRRVDVRQPKWMAAMATVLLLAAIATNRRNVVWTDAVVLWEDTVAKSPGNARAHFQLAQAYYDRGDYAKALPQYEKVAELEQPDDRLYVDWGLAYDQLNQPEQALAKLKQAAAMNPTAHVYSQIGMVYGKQGRNAEALEALARAEKFNPNFEITYVYRGGVHQNMGDLQAAIRDYRQALAINPHNQRAAQALVNAEASLRSRP